MTSSTPTAQVETAYKDAHGSWGGLDWESSAGSGIVKAAKASLADAKTYLSEALHIDDAQDLARAERLLAEAHAKLAEAQTERDYLVTEEKEECSTDTRAAEREGLLALEAARSGRWTEARDRAETAVEIEDYWGDAPTWMPFLEAVEAAISHLVTVDLTLDAGDVEVEGRWQYVVTVSVAVGGIGEEIDVVVGVPDQHLSTANTLDSAYGLLDVWAAGPGWRRSDGALELLGEELDWTLVLDALPSPARLWDLAETAVDEEDDEKEEER